MRLREATDVKHRLAEGMPFNMLMFEGKLTIEQYTEYLKVQYNIFHEIESKVVLPNDFIRAGKIFSDIVELVCKYEDKNVQPLSIDTSSDISAEYCKHLSSLSEESIWPHIYLNYLALLYGGQMMKKIPGSGKMFDFENSHDIIKTIRNKQLDDWADEVNVGYDYIIEIFEKLHKKTIDVQFS